MKMKMERLRIFILVSCLLATSKAEPDAQYQMNGNQMMAPPIGSYPQNQGTPPPRGSNSGQCGIMVDECCGMANDGCCQGGQQCYTYYETVCTNVAKKRCKPKFKTICVQEELPDCSIRRERRTANIKEQKCQLTPKRLCFDWERTVCNPGPGAVEAQIVWENEKLTAKENQVKQKCEEVSKCKFRDVEEIKQEQFPVENCTQIVDSREDCRNVAVPFTRVVEKIEYQTKWIQDCQTVNQPVCESSPCQQSGGCVNGGNVCSKNEYQPQTVCPESQTGASSGQCQQVNMPVCYGQLNSCQYDQQCCFNQPQQVCRQVPQRIPIKRNVTVQDVRWETKCQTFNTSRPECTTNWETRDRTVVRQECDQVIETVCTNYTVPIYEVEVEKKQQDASFVVRRCHNSTVPEKYCHVFPNADYKCQDIPTTRDYILNKVVCQERKTVEFCMNIPEGECENIPNQECKVVPRQVCQDGCSTSTQCNQCDQFRNQGGFSSCPTGTCNNMYMEDPVIAGNWGTGGGFNPGYGGNWSTGGGYNPGDGGNWGTGGSYNPGNGGDWSTGGNYNPGNGGDWNSGGNYNPGNGGYNPGIDVVEVGDQYPNNENWKPGGDWYSPDDRAQPLYQNYFPGAGGYTQLGGGTVQLDQWGQGGGYNPGDNTGNWGSGGGYNPGGGGNWNTGGGYNQGIAGIAEESQQPNKNEAFNEDIEELKEDSLVL